MKQPVRDDRNQTVCVCFCCELRVVVAPSQEVVFVCVLVEQFDLQILPRVVVNQGLGTKIGARFTLKTE